jgi:RND family efflux transporter MFP subunit
MAFGSPSLRRALVVAAGLAPAGATAAETLPPLPDGLADPPSVLRPVGDTGPADAAGARPSVGLRALVVPRHQAMLSAGITGRITAMPVRPGEPFAKGDTLVSFDCAALHANLDAARAQAQAARLDLKAKQRQLEFNSIGTIDVDLAKAEAARAAAAVAAVTAEADGCVIKAPYDGRVVGFEANPFETVKGGEDILEILDDRTLEVEVIVPSAWLRWLTEGQTFRLRLDETGTPHTAVVTRLGARIDPASQSVLITGRFQDPPAALKPGMSGEAEFQRPRDGD